MAHIRPALAAAVLATAVASSAALADLGPHSSFYEQHLHKLGVGNDVGVTYNRAKHLSYFDVSNFCLGSTSFQGHTYPNTATTKAIHTSHGKVNFHGKAYVYGSSNKPSSMPVKITSTITTSKVSGKITFLTGKCGTVKFVAKLRSSRP